MLKKRLTGAILAVVLTFLFPLVCFAGTVELKDEGINLSLQESFVVFTPDTVDSMTFDAAKFDRTTQQIKESMANNQCLLLAMSKDLECTVMFSKSESEASKAIGDLYRITDKTTADNAKKLILGKSADKAEEIKEIERNGALFYRVKFASQNKKSSSQASSQSQSSGNVLSDIKASSADEKSVDNTNSEYSVLYNVSGTSAAIFYITVMNGKTYSLCLLDGTGKLSERSNDVIDWIFNNMIYTVNYSQPAVESEANTFESVILWVVVVIAAAVLVWLVIRLVFDIKARRVAEGREKIVKKKPRR